MLTSPQAVVLASFISGHWWLLYNFKVAGRPPWVHVPTGMPWPPVGSCAVMRDLAPVWVRLGSMWVRDDEDQRLPRLVQRTTIRPPNRVQVTALSWQQGSKRFRLVVGLTIRGLWAIDESLFRLFSKPNLGQSLAYVKAEEADNPEEMSSETVYVYCPAGFLVGMVQSCVVAGLPADLRALLALDTFR